MNHRARSLSLSFVILLAVASAMPAQTRSTASQERHRASANQVRILPSPTEGNATSIEIAEDRWSARGFDLKSLIAEIYDVDARRVELPASAAATARYDVTLALTGDETPEAIQTTLKKALEQKFSLTINPESRSMDVYILTAPDGPGPALRPHLFASTRNKRSLLKQVALGDPGAAEAEIPLADMERFTYQGQTCPGAASTISASAGTIAQFRRTLEPNLDRLLVDESRLSGSYDFQIGEYRSQEELFKRLHDQLGLVVVPSQRQVVVLAVRPA